VEYEDIPLLKFRDGDLYFLVLRRLSAIGHDLIPAYRHLLEIREIGQVKYVTLFLRSVAVQATILPNKIIWSTFR